MKTERSPMLYIHIPFCVQKCQYCDFLSFPVGEISGQGKSQSCCRSGSTVEAYLEALKKEIFSLSGPGKIRISSVFIGGGTPSLLDPDQVRSLAETVGSVFETEQGAEITLEVNPGTITQEKAAAWKAAGINRVSMGVQALDDRLLKLLGRIHTAADAEESYAILRKAGFDNINFDLMSGLPSQTMQQWMETLRKAVEMHPEHLSCYSLILEEGTPFWEKQEHLQLPDEDTERDMYHAAVQFLRENGYGRYEISNFALKGRESRHNLGYWIGVPYYGVGLGASSLTSGGIRYRNTDRMEEYLAGSAVQEKIRREEQTLSEADRMEEFMFLGLRCTEGISETEFLRRFRQPLGSVYGPVLQKHLGTGLLRHESDRWYLSEKGIDVSNLVFEDFLFE